MVLHLGNACCQVLERNGVILRDGLLGISPVVGWQAQVKLSVLEVQKFAAAVGYARYQVVVAFIVLHQIRLDVFVRFAFVFRICARVV